MTRNTSLIVHWGHATQCCMYVAMMKYLPHNGKSHLAFFLDTLFQFPALEGRREKRVALGFILENYLQQQLATAFHLGDYFV